jgi:hypothetical protein
MVQLEPTDPMDLQGILDRVEQMVQQDQPVLLDLVVQMVLLI